MFVIYLCDFDHFRSVWMVPKATVQWYNVRMQQLTINVAKDFKGHSHVSFIRASSHWTRANAKVIKEQSEEEKFRFRSVYGP